MQDKVVKVSDGWSEISPYLPSIWRACLTIAMFVLNVCKVLLLNVCHHTELPRVRTAQEKRREVSQIWKLQPVLIPLKRSPCQHSRLWWILVRSFSVVVQGWLGWEESSNKAGRQAGRDILRVYQSPAALRTRPGGKYLLVEVLSSSGALFFL